MSSRYMPAAMRSTLTTSNRFAVLDEEGVGGGSGSGAGASGMGAGGAGAAASIDTTGSNGSYSDRFRARKATTSKGVAPPPNLESVHEFPTLGGGSLQRPHSTSAHTSSSSSPAINPTTSSWASKAVALAERDAREEEAHALAEMQRQYEEERRAIERSQFLGGSLFQRHGPTGPTVTDYEEEDRLRGVLDVRDTYCEEGSHTPPYGRYETMDGEGSEELDREEEIRDRW